MRLPASLLCVCFLLLSFATTHSQSESPPYGPLPLPPVETITLENANRLEKIAAIGNGNLHSQAAWSPDGTRLAVPSSAGVWLYDAHDWTAFPLLLETFDTYILTLAYSPDGRFLYGGAGNGRLYVWDAAARAEVTRLESELTVVHHLVLSPDGTRLAAADYGTGVALWQIDAADAPVNLQQIGFEEARRVEQVHFTPEGTRLYAGGRTSDGAFVLVFDAQTGELLPDAPLVPVEVLQYAFDFSPDGRLVAGQTLSDGLHIRDFATGEPLHTLPVERSYEVKFLADSQRLLVSVVDEGVQLWDVTSGEKLRDLPGLTTYNVAMVPSPDELNVAYGTYATVEVWSLQSDEPLAQLRSHDIRLDDSSTITFSGTGRLAYHNREDRSVWLADLDSGHFERLDSRTPNMGALAFNAQGDWLIGSGGLLYLWYLPEHLLAAAYPHESSSTAAVAFHPDGQSYVSGGSVVRVWDFASRRLTQAVGERFGYVEALVFDETGARLASAQRIQEDSGPHWRVVLWDTTTYQPALTLENRLGPIAFQPGHDRMLIHECLQFLDYGVCEARLAHVVEISTGELVYTLPYAVDSPVFSADGSFMVGTVDGDLVLWDMELIGQLSRWPSHLHSAQVALSPDGRTLVTMSGAFPGPGSSGIGWVWGVPADE